ncbi:LysR family transcriptional regulator [Bordetella ansorpii]|uniref:LysR family transcriptional regulator n=1 Tax=Bordetella ansorpii TaxID=288768 RepID=A0A157L9U6_9BORD|nr:LysR substrate-binding domain-containing protein [Bordetella ansorpii]SAH93583.1 LysR family transcriptional regulator [Bordetella ansorpii]
MISLDSKLLDVFAVVAEELHFGRAAQRLHMSQPPLSQSVRRLEALLEVKLLERTTRSVRLTPAGAELYRRVQRMQADADATVRAVRQAGKGEVGRLTIGLTPSAAYTGVPQAMFAFSQRYPGIALSLQEMNSSEMPDALHRRSLDLALLRPPFADADLAPERIHTEPMVLAVRQGHALSRRRSVTLAQVAELELIGYSRVNSRYFSQVLHRMLASTGKPPRIVQESMIPTILALVEAGFGAAVVPASLARMRNDALAYVAIRGADAMQAELLAAHHPANLNPAIEAFLGILRGRS